MLVSVSPRPVVVSSTGIEPVRAASRDSKTSSQDVTNTVSTEPSSDVNEDFVVLSFQAEYPGQYANAGDTGREHMKQPGTWSHEALPRSQPSDER